MIVHMKKEIVVVFIFITHGYNVLSQNREIFVGLDIPIYYSFGYEHEISEHISLNGKLGVLTNPFDVIILDLLKEFDADELLVNTIGDAFSVGINLQPTLKWYIRKTYIGLSYSFLMLNAKDCPIDAIENYYEISIPDRYSSSLTLQSNLHNAGFILGRKFNIKGSRYAVNLEFSLMKTFASNSYLKKEREQSLESLSNAIDNKLNQYFVNYGYFPSINVFFVYKL
ncbi:MAG: hypothetical protein A2X13_06865 [Bacteroidetes bacterium GWC2_33_15]|nr:MAG: hypothetical protein A2X10_02295 [Bacteroidetes bacterium GWA2_33_15]OFX52502.1 MAG: hypothetical protein A2X13_06865 [Bacteroidetes bacterium GWC2_33_15]OFX65563.1 MAG: hypothetical protein A2X15_14980 [Bacteroidetes bacterium GWB2_32_14]OFX67584.1 MAG: hypothetical protein A2X14_11700 [Bacteroidetes bacterium GWD2_33_33]HAN18369.1 hypothetical protein [Bacteroidales bacterium]